MSGQSDNTTTDEAIEATRNTLRRLATAPTIAPSATYANSCGAGADAIDVLLKRLQVTQEWLDRFQGALGEANFKLMIRDARITELLKANNEFEDRARQAERRLKEALRVGSENS